ncbi:DUF418 domain-containing protein [Desmospora profundinema]|uniref:DUF418 domain-containing protein n=1 Tax=Desmospora profundinema TaxID=1571184 RepID=A0ABU1IT82_9BACL|nr:DUF418 domain-containing protein [Desmospora profundinema]MDR6227409.1 uncharacterized protein [Desmospora profundinema]
MDLKTSVSAEKGNVSPIRTGDRIFVIDGLRGFALFGILVVNMSFFHSPSIYLMMSDTVWWTGFWDQAAERFVYLFAEGNFYTLFSLLFGFGMILFMERVQQKGSSFVPLYARRLMILLFFGLVHALLIWYGDILFSYALLGFVLLLFRRCSPQTLLVWALILLLMTMLLFGVLAGLTFYTETLPERSEEGNAFEEWIQSMIQSSVAAYGSGSFAEITQQRATDWLFLISWSVIGFWPIILAMFLLGAYVAKRRILHDIPTNLPLIRHIWCWSLILALATVLLQGMEPFLGFTSDSAAILFMMVETVIGNPATCLFYASSLVLLLQRERWVRRLSFFRDVGRMSLSNYLMQSLICTTLFYSYGFGWYGKVGPLGGLGLAVLIFAAQAVISRFWLKKFRFGPMEWVWRSLTYGRRQPFRI